MTGPVSAVVFDVGRVLVQWDLRCLFAKLIDDPAELEWFVNTVVTEEWHFQHDAGRPLAEMVPERIARFPGLRPPYRSLCDAIQRDRARPGARQPGAVSELHEAGVPLYAITNFGAEFWPRFRPAWPVFDQFRDVVVSGIEKVAKPDPRIFHIAASRFGHAPGAMLFIDDNEANIAAARACGWQAHHFTSAGRLAPELRARGLIG